VTNDDRQEPLDLKNELVFIARMRNHTHKLMEETWLTLEGQGETLYLSEELVRIARMRNQTNKLIEETRLATPQMFQGALMMATLIAAGAALGTILCR
jgi:hypothetical protein